MKARKTVLILTDGSGGAVEMAAGIAAALKGNKVSVKSAPEFSGDDLLPAEVFFLGCGKPAPESFAYLEDLLKHINLAGRSCGVFSSGTAKAADYLASLARGTGASLDPGPFVNGSGEDMADWAREVVSGAPRGGKNSLGEL